MRDWRTWNHSLKVEAIHGERFITRNQAKAHVFEYIEVYNNRKRLHSKLGYLSPETFEARNAAYSGVWDFGARSHVNIVFHESPVAIQQSIGIVFAPNGNGQTAIRVCVDRGGHQIIERRKLLAVTDVARVGPISAA